MTCQLTAGPRCVKTTEGNEIDFTSNIDNIRRNTHNIKKRSWRNIYEQQSQPDIDR